MDLKTYDRGRWFLGPLERVVWSIFSRLYRRYEINGLEVIDVRGDDDNSAKVSAVATEAIGLIIAAGEPFMGLVANELSFVAAVAGRGRISRNLRAYFWHFSGRETEGDSARLALGIVGAACYLEQERKVREMGRPFDHLEARNHCFGILEEFARDLPRPEVWVSRVRKWQKSA